MNVCFIVAAHYIGSSQMRGHQIKAALAQQGITSSVLDWNDVSSCSDIDLMKFDTFVFVKFPAFHILERLRFKFKAKYLLDIIDNYSVHKDLKDGDNRYDLFDAFIAVNTYHYMFIRKETLCIQNKPVWLIPFHHTNFKNLVIDAHKPVRNIGFQGDISNRMPRMFEQELEGFCDNHNVKWLPFYIERGSETSNPVSAFEASAFLHQQLHNMDISIIFPPSISANSSSLREDVWERLLFKPATRLINSFSHGIPTICFPYTGYMEACVSSGYPLFCTQEGELFNLLEGLITNIQLRLEASDRGREIARRYSLEMIASTYVRYLIDADFG